jgi:hypothetical protein
VNGGCCPAPRMLTSAKPSNPQPRSSATTFSLDSVLRFFRVSVSRGSCRVSWRVAAQGRILRENLSREPEKRPGHAGPDQDREGDGAGNRAQRLVAVQIDVGPYQRAKSRRSGEAQDDPGAGEKLGQPFPHANWCGSVSQRFTEIVHPPQPRSPTQWPVGQHEATPTKPARAETLMRASIHCMPVKARRAVSFRNGWFAWSATAPEPEPFRF